MKLFLLIAAILAVAAPSFGQTATADPTPAAPTTRFSLSDAIDLKGKVTTTVAYDVRQFTDVWGKSGLNLDLKGLATVDSSLRVGFALTYDLHKTIPFSKEFRPKLDLSIGPWCNYGANAGKLGGGIYVGLGVRF